jgi:hypothetical protein
MSFFTCHISTSRAKSKKTLYGIPIVSNMVRAVCRVASLGMKRRRARTSKQEASTQTHQGEYLPPRHVWTYGRKDTFSFCVGRIGRKQPTLGTSHGIGGNATSRTGVVIVGYSVIVDIVKTRGTAGIRLQKVPLINRSLLLPF